MSYFGTCSRVVNKIESSRRDGKSNRGDFLIFVFQMLVKLSYAFREAGAFIRVDSEMCQLPAYFGNSAVLHMP